MPTRNTITTEQGEDYFYRINNLFRKPICPVCENRDIVWDMKNIRWREDGELALEVECLKCKVTWTETYVLSAAVPLGE